MKRGIHIFTLMTFLMFGYEVVNAQTVYVTKNSKVYHSLSCVLLNQGMHPSKLSALSLSEAVGMGYTACKKCDAPRVSDANPADYPNANTIIGPNGKRMVVVGRCRAITKKGERCKNDTEPGSLYCRKHGGGVK